MPPEDATASRVFPLPRVPSRETGAGAHPKAPACGVGRPGGVGKSGWKLLDVLCGRRASPSQTPVARASGMGACHPHSALLSRRNVVILFESAKGAAPPPCTSLDVDSLFERRQLTGGVTSPPHLPQSPVPSCPPPPSFFTCRTANRPCTADWYLPAMTHMNGGLVITAYNTGRLRREARATHSSFPTFCLPNAHALHALHTPMMWSV